MSWQPYDEGKTIGRTGSEGGVIQRDEEYAGSARITLEEGCLRAPYATTCGVYGYFFVHTRFLADDETALYALDEMKSALVDIVELLPGENDADVDAKLEVVYEAMQEFVRRFP